MSAWSVHQLAGGKFGVFYKDDLGCQSTTSGVKPLSFAQQGDADKACEMLDQLTACGLSREDAVASVEAGLP